MMSLAGLRDFRVAMGCFYFPNRSEAIRLPPGRDGHFALELSADTGSCAIAVSYLVDAGLARTTPSNFRVTLRRRRVISSPHAAASRWVPVLQPINRCLAPSAPSQKREPRPSVFMSI